VNQNGRPFFWVAFEASPHIKLGTYSGTGSSQAVSGIAFQPDYLILMEAGASTNRALHHSYHSASTFSFTGDPPFASAVTALSPNGFTVGTSAYANESGRTYHYVAWDERPGSMRVGRYTGDDTDPRSIAVGFRPEYLIVKGIDVTEEAVQRFAPITGDNSLNFKNGFASNWIQAFEPNGFQVGNDNRVNNSGNDYLFVAFGNSGKPGLVTTEAPGTITVTAPDYFDMKFSTAVGGGVEEYHDLASGPSSGIDLAGGTTTLGALLFDTMSVGPIWYNSGENDAGAQLDLLEVTPTRVKVRSESFYQQEGGSVLLAGIKSVGDYSVHPSGRMALRWERRTTKAISSSRSQMGMAIHRTTAAPLSGWRAWSESSDLDAAPGLGTDVFVLGRIHDTGFGTYNDFLQVLYRRWTAADTTGRFVNGAAEWLAVVWDDANPYALPPLERWDSLLYFKPTDFVDNADPNVLARRSDYRGPDPLPVSVGWGWNENTADADFFNESEAAYTVDFDPSNGLAFTMNGSSTARFQPVVKIRQWRSLKDPADATLNGVPLANDVEFKADVKPVARAHFASDLLWHSTLHSAGDVTAPDVGSPGAVNGGTAFVGARYGNGARFSAPGNTISFPASSNLRVDRGAVELWYLPEYAHTDGAAHRIWTYFVDANHQFRLTKDASNDLVFEILRGGVSTRVTVTSADYRWLDFEWVHLKATWDAAAVLADQVRIYVNQVEPAHTNPTNPYNAGLMPSTGLVYLGGDDAGSLSASGILDELRVYGTAASTTSLARGGLTASSSEHLASPTLNFTLALSAVDALRRGAYVYFGADSRFRGLNVSLQSPGSGSVDLVWQYWNGAGWADLESGVGFVDETSHFTRHGSIHWSADPFGWSEVSIDGDVDLYYVRARLGSGSYATFPVEKEIRTDILLFQYCEAVTAASQTFAFGLPPADDVSITSAFDQSFPVGATTPVVAATITVTDVFGGSITPGNEIRIRIPAGFPLRWNTAVAGPSLGGSAATKVNPTLKPYEDLDQTLVVNVVTTFGMGDQLTLSGLEFVGFTNPSPPDNLELETGDDGSVAAFDDKTLQVTAAGAATISSFDNQRFTVGQPATPAETIFISEGIAASTIRDATDIRIHIPATLAMEWDNVTSISVSGTASTKVSTTVSYPTSRIVLVNVAADFGAGEYVAISGLRFKNFSTPPNVDRLGLDVNNDANPDDTDDKTIVVETASDVPFFTATATDLNVKLEWLNPPFGACDTIHIRRRSDDYPATPSDGTPVDSRSCFGLPGNKEFFDDNLGISNDTTYYYAIFVEHSPGNFVPGPGKRVKARPFDTSGPVKWAYSTAASSMATPGLRFFGGSAYVYAVSNDKILHAMRGGVGGGDWPAGWKPHVLGAPAQARPPVLGFAVGASPQGVALLGSQDGSVYAVNAETGALEWSRAIGSMVQAAPAGNFKGGGWDPTALDLVLVGTRNSSAPNAFVALALDGGAEQWRFDNALGQNGTDLPIGIIAGGAAVDYSTKRVYFASRTQSGGSTDTVWCVNFAANPPQRVWSQSIGNVDGSPILFGGVVYVGTNSGEIYALDPLTGGVQWSLPLADGAVKSFVFPHYGTDNLFASTASKVWSINRTTASVNAPWPVTSANVPSPSTPTVKPGGTRVLLGGGDGKLWSLDAVNPLPGSSVVLGDGTAAVGTPALDVINNMVYVGTDQGVIYGVLLPLP
jgi:outer membrane protein assembly factor BamB